MSDKNIVITITATPNPKLCGTFNVSGIGSDYSALVGSTLTASLTSANSTNFHFVWYDDDNNILATTAAYTVPADMLGKMLYVKAVANDKEENGELIESCIVYGESHDLTIKVINGSTVTINNTASHNDSTYSIPTGKLVEVNSEYGEFIRFFADIPGVDFRNYGNAIKFVMPNSDVTITGDCAQLSNRNLENATVENKQTNFEYDGKKHIPEYKVTLSSSELNRQWDYRLSDTEGNTFDGQSEVGIYYANIVTKLTGLYSGSKRVSFAIVPNTSGNASLEKSEFEYTGAKIEPVVKVTSNLSTPLVKGKDYEIAYPESVAPGTYKAIVTFTGNFMGTKELTYKIINKVNPPKPSVKVELKKTAYTYSRQNIKPSVVVTNQDGKNLVKDKDFTVTYPKKSKDVGNYKLTVAFKGDYKSFKSQTLKYQIVPKATSLVRVTGQKKAISVIWKSQKEQTTGYMIKYSTNSDMSKAKTITVKASATSKLIKGLKKNKTYYVQVCTYKTVKGKKICSAWSKVKKNKTNK